MTARRVLRLMVAEVWWWLSGLVRLLRRRPRRVLLVSLLAVFLLWGDPQWGLLGLLGVLLLLPALWARLWPVSYRLRVVDPAWRRQTRRQLSRTWPGLMRSCGLGQRAPGLDGSAAVLHTPTLRGVSWQAGRLVAVPGLLVGQTVDDVLGAAERLRTALGATSIRVEPDSTGTRCRVVWMFGDPLAAPFDAVVPDRDAALQLESAVMGRTEDGDPWRLDLRVSTLLAGSPGSGKASAMWGLMLALAPAVRAGLVEVTGIDLKGGMELAMGRPLFTRYAVSTEEAVTVLEETGAALQARARILAGVVRTHQPTPADPLQVVLIDELAMLTAYTSDRDLLRRGEAALSLILSQGRAVGFYVFGFVQDPRKDTVKMRHLFPQSFGLRLRDREEVAMVLGDGAVGAGALCHKISRTTPGVGYVLAEDGRVLRVRAGYVTDAMIRELAARFPAPRQIPISLSDPDPDAGRTSRSSTRRPRGKAAADDAAAGKESAA